MKKVFNLKAIVLVLVLVLSFTLLVACDKDNDEGDTIEIPEFSIEIIDGEDTITLTEADVKDLDLVNHSHTNKEEITTYYKGFSFTDVLEALDISQTGITNVRFAEYIDGEEDYGRDLEVENLDTGILAVLASQTADGEFAEIGEDGPVIAYSSAEDTSFKNIKHLNTITIER